MTRRWENAAVESQIERRRRVITGSVAIHIKLRFTGHVHIHSQHSLSTTQKIHIYTSSAYLCIQMIDRSHDNIHT